ncbi:MAG: hypothetical protein WBM02_00930 [bacterium]
MKKVLLLITISVLCMIAGSTAFAQIEQLSKLDIKAIQKMQFIETGTSVMMKNVFVFVNKGLTDVKLRNAEFEVSLKTDDKEFYIGKGKFDELVFQAAEQKEDSIVPYEFKPELEIKIGPKNDETTQKLMTLFNIIGNPDVSFTLLLKGTSEVGLKGEKGWLYQTGFAVEFEFKPKYQRTVLFE